MTGILSLPREMIKSLLTRFSFVRGDVNRNDRAGALHRAWGHVFTNHLVGDYYEFGVYKGDSLIESYRQFGKFRHWLDAQTRSPELWRRDVAAKFAVHMPPRFIGLDTFVGLPKNEEGAVSFGGGHYAWGEEDVQAACDAAGLKPILIKGLFADTREETRRAGRKAAIVNLDGDLYLSAVDALETITPLVQLGTVLMCDDYRAFNNDRNKGERRALAEWEAKTGIEAEPWFAYHFAGQAFLLHVQN